MKSGYKGLIGPGDNNYGRDIDHSVTVKVKTTKSQRSKLELLQKMIQEPVKELTPELSEKIWNAIQKKHYDDKVSKEAVLHHLKQLKAQMGKLIVKGVIIKNHDRINGINEAVRTCMNAIDKKIAKIKQQ